jgi:hypothetical protein
MVKLSALFRTTKVGVFILALLLPLAMVTHAQEPQERRLLRLQVGAFDPLLDGVPHLTTAAASAQPAPDHPYYIIQFAGPIEEAWTAQIEQLGATLLGYIPDNAHVARIAPDDLAKIRAMYAVRWVGPYQAGYKLSPKLNDVARLSAGSSMDVSVITFPGESAAALETMLNGLGATIHQISDTPIGVIATVTIQSAAASQISAYPGVSWVEPYVTPTIANAEARKIMNAESVWQSNNLFGAGQIVAISDSGLSVQDAISADFEGRLVRAYAPSEMRPESAACRAKTNWTDLNGHGTHVAGSVLGNGRASGSNPAAKQYTNSHAGVAPEARMVFMAMNTDGASAIQCIPSNGNYIAFGYQNGARISSNSWGANTNGAYTANDSVIDDYVWRNRDYLVLFAAGNAGPSVGTIGSPGSAKNIISVGASDNYRPEYGAQNPLGGENVSDDPNQMTFFSSRGPVEDGRIKPDLVAPGGNIISVLAAEAGGLEPIAPGQPYAASSGTSMATPLVAGAAALTREWLTTQRNVANPSAALMKALLINGAVQLPGASTPNNNSGWGRTDLKNTLTANYAVFDDYVQGLRSGEQITRTVQVAGSNSAGTLFVTNDTPGPNALSSLRLTTESTTNATTQTTGNDPTTFRLDPTPGYDTPKQQNDIRDGDKGSREEAPPAAGLSVQANPKSAARFTTTPADPTAQNFLQNMVGGGDFEDPDWSAIWSQVWLGEGQPVRTDGSDGGIVVRGDHSVWLGGSPTNDLIAYPISFPRTIANDFPSKLNFLVDQRNRDPGFDLFCVAVTDSSGYPFGSGNDQMIYCGDDLPTGTRSIEIIFTASQKRALAGQTGYLTLFNSGDGETPHMSAFVDNITFAVDFPNVTLSAAPTSGPPGTTFLLSGSNNVPYGEVNVCVDSCNSAANQLGSVYADDRGDILAYLETRTTATPGVYTIETRNIAGRKASTRLTISGAGAPTLSVDPQSGPGGTSFALSGSGFLPNDSEIAVSINGESLGTTGSNASGAVAFRLTTSSNTPAGTYNVQLSDSANRQANVAFQVTAAPGGSPTMTVDPATGGPGTAFRFNGSGFAPNAAVDFSLDGQALGQTDTDGGGSFAVTLSTDSDIAPGSYTFIATQGSARASAQFQITGGGGGGGETPSGAGLYVTLAWTDPPAQPAADRTLVNNLNLRVEGPGGSFFGNGGSGPDARNNVEIVRIERPAPGTYTIVVEAQSVNGAFGAQPFALVATTAQNFGAGGPSAGIDGANGGRVHLPLVRR